MPQPCSTEHISNSTYTCPISSSSSVLDPIHCRQGVLRRVQQIIVQQRMLMNDAEGLRFKTIRSDPASLLARGAEEGSADRFPARNHGQDVQDSGISGLTQAHCWQGVLRKGQQIEVRPGIITKDAEGRAACKPIFSRIMTLLAEQNELQYAVPGGLIGVGTTVSPAGSMSGAVEGLCLAAGCGAADGSCSAPRLTLG